MEGRGELIVGLDIGTTRQYLPGRHCHRFACGQVNVVEVEAAFTALSLKVNQKCGIEFVNQVGEVEFPAAADGVVDVHIKSRIARPKIRSYCPIPAFSS